MKENQNKGLQSRREFFKKAAKATLPVIGSLVMMNIPLSATAQYGCNYSCFGSCYNTCYGTCFNRCLLSCTGSCVNGCLQTCYQSCNGTCMTTAANASW